MGVAGSYTVFTKVLKKMMLRIREEIAIFNTPVDRRQEAGGVLYYSWRCILVG